MITATVAVVHTIEHALFPYKQLLVVVVAAVYKVVYEKCCFICTLFAALFTSALRSLLHQSHQQHVSIMQMLVLLLLLLFILLPVLELCSPRHRCGRSGVCQSSTVCVCDDQKLANRNQKLKSCWLKCCCLCCRCFMVLLPQRACQRALQVRTTCMRMMRKYHSSKHMLTKTKTRGVQKESLLAIKQLSLLL